MSAHRASVRPAAKAPSVILDSPADRLRVARGTAPDGGGVVCAPRRVERPARRAGRVAAAIALTSTGALSLTTEPARFTHVAAGAAGATSTATARITVAADNDAPRSPTVTIEGVDDGTGAVRGTIVTTDPGGDDLTYTLVAGPERGEVVVNADGTFVYTPAPISRLTAGRSAGAETDRFTVTVSDGQESVDIAPVVTVSATEIGIAHVVKVGPNPRTIVLHPDGRRAYIQSSGGPITVYDRITGEVESAITVDGGPNDLLVSPDGRYLYVTAFGAFDDPDTLSVIDTESDTVIETLIVSRSLSSAAISPDGSRLYLSTSTGVVVVDTTTYATVAVDMGRPSVAAVSPDNTAYVPNLYEDGTVSVIDSGNQAAGVITGIGSRPGAAALVHGGEKLYVLNDLDHTVAVVDTSTNEVDTVIPAVGNTLAGKIWTNADGSRAYVDFSDNTTSTSGMKVIDTDSDTVIGVIPMRTTYDVKFSPDGRLAYITGAQAGGVNEGLYVLDTADNTQVAFVPIGDYVFGLEAADIAVSYDGNTIYVSNPFDGVMTIVAITPSEANL